MRVSRLYLDHALESRASLDVAGERAHYLRNVLRLKPGCEIIIFNGRGLEADAIVGHAKERDVLTLNIGTIREVNRESPLKIHLALGISRSERMDFALQKSVEMGVNILTPLLTERCVVQLDSKKRQQRHEHWQGIMLAACEQSGRNVLPALQITQTLTDWTTSGQWKGLALMPDPLASTRLSELPRPTSEHCTLVIGPEGGLSQQERENVQSAGFIPICLGPRILRTETAALATIAAIQTLWGDLG